MREWKRLGRVEWAEPEDWPPEPDPRLSWVEQPVRPENFLKSLRLLVLLWSEGSLESDLAVQ